ncbi:NRDE family protein [Halococcus dombrowskii]|uniref:NRDE family protein n=1 Tax=Halococcus dombrowskii TaxID=179637 RepID=A0AAV3SHH5_HALDO|nr:NRDE family protein [Halococcus dombrowskii]UOO93862.1 NRDE family protein [Halococcus dombrowskii]
MCTLVLAWQVFADRPVAVAANRDEAVDRESNPPELLSDDPAVLAPSDAEAGGTWIGYNEHGLFVAVTNRWTDRELAGERSRGLLVRDALEHDSAEAAARHVERAVETDEYEGFNVVVADAQAAILLEWDGQLRVRNLDPGVHVVMNTGAIGDVDVPESWPERGERQAENGRQVRATLQPDPGETSQAWIDRAADVLGDHDYGVCVHHEEFGFGTRSSSLISIDEDGDGEYAFADGPPCRTAFEPVERRI